MNRYGEVTLCTTTALQDRIGQAIEAAVNERTIQGKIVSIGRDEWLTAQQGGYQSEVMIEVFSASYMGEHIAQYAGKTYEVYRTFQSGDKTELYLGTRIGDIP